MKHLILFIFIITTASVFGQSPFQAPLNPDFLNQKEKKGYVHPPLKIEHNKVPRLKDATILPESYDLRDVDGNSYIPAIRNQNPYGTCWTFATMASIESNWKKSGDNAFIDLSEANMAKCHGYEFDIDSGGNQYMSTAYLTRLSGPFYESEDPYANISSRVCLTPDKDRDIPAYIDNVLWLGNDRSTIKQTIMKYGAVATSMYSDFSSNYYNSTDNTFYYNGTNSTDHGVAIVGWDDNKVVTGGSQGSPSQAGAWIIRNSWGTAAQVDGYFYASYEDIHLGKECEMYYGKTPTNQIDTILDYAELGAISSFSAGNMNNTYGYAALKHHSDQDLFITHVGSAILDEGTVLDISICRQFDGTSFSDTLATLNNVTCNYAGYKKIELPCFIEAGDFYVIIKYTTLADYFPLPAELKIDDYANPTIEEGVMWISSNGSDWNAGGKHTSYNFDLAAKVYAKYIDGLQAYFTSERSQACINQEITFYNNTIGEADSFLWAVNDEVFLTENKEESFSYSFSSAGLKTVSLSAYKNGIPSTLIKTNNIDVVADLYPNILIAEPADYYSKGNPITLLGDGGDNYTWYAEGYLTGESGSTVSITPLVDELWVYMDASMGQCSGRDSILLKMVSVPYDNIEDALELTLGQTVEKISNQYASVQSKEPTPPTGGCSTQNSWCEEGGLQNTLWFKFTAPSSGRVIIDSYGFDNQLALYDAVATGTWQDILSGDDSQYALLAANDDYHDKDYSAKIEEVSNLTVGKTYWIQMDGSAGGSTGEMSITLSNPVSVLDHETELQDFTLINTLDQFTIQGKQLNGARIAVYHSTGQLVYQSTVADTPKEIDNQAFTPGFYLIFIQNKDKQHTFKTIAKHNWQLRIEER